MARQRRYLLLFISCPLLSCRDRKWPLLRRLLVTFTNTANLMRGVHHHRRGRRRRRVVRVDCCAAPWPLAISAPQRRQRYSVGMGSLTLCITRGGCGWSPGTSARCWLFDILGVAKQQHTYSLIIRAAAQHVVEIKIIEW